ISAEESEVDSHIPCPFRGVTHRLRPVFVVTDREKGLVIEESIAVGVCVDVRRVAHIVAGPLEPPYEVDLPGQEASITSVRVGSVERDFYCLLTPRDCVGTGAVVCVEALAGRAIVRVVVVCLVCRYAL